MKGSLIPLLSLNVGFSGELDAHDNVYQYGMILGFSKKEMDAMYDDIIAYSGLEKYQYMRLKNFSTGMRIKLGFSTAVRIDPDILVLDEILSVGDMSFKEKSKQKILDFCNSNKTVVIVSHSMTTISDICDRALFLKEGKIGCIGDPEEVIDEYTEYMQKSISPKKILFSHRTPEIIHRERDQGYTNRLLGQVSNLGIFSLIRCNYNADVERSLNEYLTWENLKKVSELENIRSGDGFAGRPVLGAPVISFLRELGDKSASRATADKIIGLICSDGLICLGNPLESWFNRNERNSTLPVRIAALLICNGLRIVPVICDPKEIRTINYHLANRILNADQLGPQEGATIVIPEEFFNNEGISMLRKKSIRFLVPLPGQEIERQDFSTFFNKIISPDNLMFINDRVIFAAGDHFDLKGLTVDGYGYFNPNLIQSDYNAFFRRLSKIKNEFEQTGRELSVEPETLISEIAKKDSAYFLGRLNNGCAEISYDAESIIRRQKLMGMELLFHFGTWHAEECYRYHVRRLMMEKSFNFYRKIAASDDPVSRGKALASLINTAVRMGLFNG